ncbi:MAG: C-GCAxxG-C-C family protein [Treponema sp.]|nr:C-GCAxxG-C-C family protein [Treponema sp.]
MGLTKEERAESAAQLKRTGQCNCCQAVVKVYAGDLSVDEESLLSLASGFAAGMGCMEGTCGALVGAAMVCGLKSKGKAVPAKTRKLLAKFKEMSGATICKDLKGGLTGKVLCECDDCVKNAVLALEELE